MISQSMYYIRIGGTEVLKYWGIADIISYEQYMPTLCSYYVYKRRFMHQVTGVNGSLYLLLNPEVVPWGARM